MRTGCPFSAHGTRSEGDPLEAVRSARLPESIRTLLDAYDETVGDRDRFLWRWLYQLFPAFRLSCVDDDRSRQVRDAKLILSLFVAVADDVAEKRGDRATFSEVATIPFGHRSADPDRSDVDGDTVRFLEVVWDRFEGYFDESPRAAEFADVLRFDVEQVLTAIEYSALANRRLELVSEAELWAYDVHNMMVFVYADVDLANARAFDTAELAALRHVVTHTQRMARIGNWLTTWKRELAEGDCTSGVVVRALDTDVVPIEDLRAVRTNPTAENVDRVARAIGESDVESEFHDRWDAEYAAARRYVREHPIESVNIGAYLEGFETVFRYHLASEGEK